MADQRPRPLRDRGHYRVDLQLLGSGEPVQTAILDVREVPAEPGVQERLGPENGQAFMKGGAADEKELRRALKQNQVRAEFVALALAS